MCENFIFLCVRHESNKTPLLMNWSVARGDKSQKGWAGSFVGQLPYMNVFYHTCCIVFIIIVHQDRVDKTHSRIQFVLHINLEIYLTVVYNY